MATAGAFGVIRVNRATVDGRDRALQTAGLVERVRMNSHLDITLVGDLQALANSSWGLVIQMFAT